MLKHDAQALLKHFAQAMPYGRNGRNGLTENPLTLTTDLAFSYAHARVQNR